MKTKLTPPKWKDKEEYEEAYAETMRLLTWIFWLSVVACFVANFAANFVPGALYWTFWFIALGSSLLSIVVLFLGMLIKRDRPNVVAWYEENQGDDAVTININE